MMTEKFEELYSELNAMDSQEIKDAIEEAMRKGCKNIIAPFEVRCIIEAQQETINRQKAEIKGLTSGKCVYLSDDEDTEYCVEGPCPNYKTEEQIKAEAFKEFAERLQDRCNKQGGCLYASDIGAELNEMVSEAE